MWSALQEEKPVCHTEGLAQSEIKTKGKTGSTKGGERGASCPPPTPVFPKSYEALAVSKKEH